MRFFRLTAYNASLICPTELRADETPVSKIVPLAPRPFSSPRKNGVQIGAIWHGCHFRFTHVGDISMDGVYAENANLILIRGPIVENPISTVRWVITRISAFVNLFYWRTVIWGDQARAPKIAIQSKTVTFFPSELNFKRLKLLLNQNILHNNILRHAVVIVIWIIFTLNQWM